MGAWLIATRNVNTLVLVHRRQLLDQWRARLAAGLGLPPKSIGQIGAGKTRPTGVIDVGILQSLNRKGEVSDLVAGYGQVIVDECHHVSAFSFEPDPAEQDRRKACRSAEVLVPNAVPSRYLVGALVP